MTNRRGKSKRTRSMKTRSMTSSESMIGYKKVQFDYGLLQTSRKPSKSLNRIINHIQEIDRQRTRSYKVETTTRPIKINEDDAQLMRTIIRNCIDKDKHYENLNNSNCKRPSNFISYLNPPEEKDIKHPLNLNFFKNKSRKTKSKSRYHQRFEEFTDNEYRPRMHSSIRKPQGKMSRENQTADNFEQFDNDCSNNGPCSFMDPAKGELRRQCQCILQQGRHLKIRIHPDGEGSSSSENDDENGMSKCEVLTVSSDMRIGYLFRYGCKKVKKNEDDFIKEDIRKREKCCKKKCLEDFRNTIIEEQSLQQPMQFQQQHNNPCQQMNNGSNLFNQEFESYQQMHQPNKLAYSAYEKRPSNEYECYNNKQDDETYSVISQGEKTQFDRKQSDHRPRIDMLEKKTNSTDSLIDENICEKDNKKVSENISSNSSNYQNISYRSQNQLINSQTSKNESHGRFISTPSVCPPIQANVNSPKINNYQTQQCNQVNYQRNQLNCDGMLGNFQQNQENYQQNRGNYQQNRENYQQNLGNYQQNQGNYQQNQGNYQQNQGNYQQNQGNYKSISTPMQSNFQQNHGNYNQQNRFNQGSTFTNNSCQPIGVNCQNISNNIVKNKCLKNTPAKITNKCKREKKSRNISRCGEETYESESDCNLDDNELMNKYGRDKYCVEDCYKIIMKKPPRCKQNACRAEGVKESLLCGYQHNNEIETPPKRKVTRNSLDIRSKKTPFIQYSGEPRNKKKIRKIKSKGSECFGMKKGNCTIQ